MTILRHSRPAIRILAGVLVVLLASIVTSQVLAQQSRLPEIVRVRIGFDGRYKLGRWTPLEITLRGGSKPAVGRLSVVVPDGDDTPSRFTSPLQRPIQVLPGEITSGSLFVKIGRELSDLVVNFDTADGDHVEEKFDVGLDRSDRELPWALSEGQKLYVIVGAPIGIPESTGSEKLTEQVVLPDTSELPTRWYGYDAVDTLIFATSRPEAFRQLRENSAQLAALEEWLTMGGRLMLVAGSEAHALLDAGAPLARFAPGKLVDIETLKRGDALEKFVRTSRHIPFAGRGENKGILAARLENPSGRVLVEEGDLPLVIQSPRGFGEITFVGCDLDRRPLADWQSRGALVNKLLGDAPASTNKAAQRGPVYGFTDLAGQLRGAIDQFSGVTVVPFWVVGTLIFGYMLLVGPIDYLIVRRLFKRTELTWITFPLMVAIVSVGAYAAAYRTKGNQLRINQVELIDVDATSGELRGTSWVNIFSPRTASYDLSLAPHNGPTENTKETPNVPTSEPPEVIFSWLGLPGSAWNGMQATGSTPRLFARPYQFASNLDALLGVPIDVWSTKSFTARWHATAASELQADLTATERQTLEGSVISNLPFALDDAILAHDRWAYSIGTLEPGQTITVEPRLERDLQTVLKNFRAVKNEQNSSVAYQAAPFDQAGFSVPEIIRQMMFYDAVEGENYSQLKNDYQSFVDLSSHLKLGQAILVGQVRAGKQSVRRVFDGGRPLEGTGDTWRFYRFVLPVARSQ